MDTKQFDIDSLSHESILQIFNSISSFEEDIWSVFKKDDINELTLYNRLLEQTKKSMDPKSVDPKSVANVSTGVKKFITGFKTFLDLHRSVILEGDIRKLPLNSKIYYHGSPRVYLDIKKYVDSSNVKNDIPTLIVMRNHLLTIDILIDPTEDKVQALDLPLNLAPVLPPAKNDPIEKNPKKVISEMMQKSGVDLSSKEGEFMRNMMENTASTFSDLDPSSISSPGEGIAALFSGGGLQTMLAGFQNGAESGNLDPRKMMSTMQSLMNNMMNMLDTVSPDGLTSDGLTSEEKRPKTKEELMEEQVERRMLKEAEKKNMEEPPKPYKPQKRSGKNGKR